MPSTLDSRLAYPIARHSASSFVQMKPRARAMLNEFQRDASDISEVRFNPIPKTESTNTC